jgi:hypothetical protein
VTGCALHGDGPVYSVLGQLVERGLHNELRGGRPMQPLTTPSAMIGYGRRFREGKPISPSPAENL